MRLTFERDPNNCIEIVVHIFNLLKPDIYIQYVSGPYSVQETTTSERKRKQNTHINGFYFVSTSAVHFHDWFE